MSITRRTILLGAAAGALATPFIRVRPAMAAEFSYKLANNQLGSDTDMLSQVRSGGVEFFTLSPLILSTLVPNASISGIGFYIACKIANVPAEQVMAKIWPYLAALMVGLLAIAAVPWFSTALL